LQCLVGTENTLPPTYKCNGDVGKVLVDEKAAPMKVGYAQILYSLFHVLRSLQSRVTVIKIKKNKKSYGG